VPVSPVLDHDESVLGVPRELHPGVFVRSFYFQDPDGILLEFACCGGCWDSRATSGTSRRLRLTAPASEFERRFRLGQ
jgi:hypothetical protein